MPEDEHRAADSAFSRSELFDLYRLSIEEYRFQVTLNWNRQQYYFILNVGIAGLATGLREASSAGTQAAALATGLYIAGVVGCVLSMLASRVQQSYYVQTRNHKRILEHRLGLGEYRIATTPGMGGTLRRVARVTTFNYAILSIIALVDGFGAGISISHSSLVTPTPSHHIVPATKHSSGLSPQSSRA